GHGRDVAAGAVRPDAAGAVAARQPGVAGDRPRRFTAVQPLRRPLRAGAGAAAELHGVRARHGPRPSPPAQRGASRLDVAALPDHRGVELAVATSVVTGPGRPPPPAGAESRPAKRDAGAGRPARRPQGAVRAVGLAQSASRGGYGRKAAGVPGRSRATSAERRPTESGGTNPVTAESGPRLQEPHEPKAG